MTTYERPGSGLPGEPDPMTDGPAGVRTDARTADGRTTVPPPRPAADDTRSLGDIIGDIASDFSALMKQEIELAKTEATAEVARAGKGAGLLAGAGVAAHLMLIALTLTLIWVLDLWMPVWAGALIVTGVWAVVAAALAVSGRGQLRQIPPPMETTQQTIKEDVQWAKSPKSS